MARYVVIALSAIGLAGAGLAALAHEDETVATARSSDRELGIRLCRADLATITAPVSVRSLLIASGRVETFMLRDLLGSRGLQFVELRAKEALDRRTNTKTYGVTGSNGEQYTNFDVAPDVKIVRLSLGKQGDPACMATRILGLDDMGGVPMAPDTCLRVERDIASHASHALKVLPSATNPAFIKWSIVEQATGQVLAGMTSSDTLLRPSSQRGGPADEQKMVVDDNVSCRSPHRSLLSLIYGPARMESERLSLGTRRVLLDAGPAEPALLAPSEAVEEAVGDWDQRNDARSGPAWKTAFRAAEASGWASYAQGVIDFKAGVIVTPRLLAMPGVRATIRGSDTGFMVAWRARTGSVVLAHFGLDGRLLWKRQLTVEAGRRDAMRDPAGMEWDRHTVRLYGFRQRADGNGYDVRVLKVNLPPM